MSKKDEIVEENETPATETEDAQAAEAPAAEAGDTETPVKASTEEASTEESGEEKPADAKPKRPRRRRKKSAEDEPSEEADAKAETEEASVEAESETAEETGTADAADEDIADADTDEGEKSDRPRRSRSRRGRTRRRRNGRDRDDNDNAASDDGDAGEEKEKLRATPLWALHKERRAKMVPFAGYDMPVQYKRGIMSEHRQTRERAGLFDVSHMGQAFLRIEGKGGHEEIAGLVEELVPGNIKGLKPGGIRYTLLLNDDGGIVDDFMVTRPEGEENEGLLFLVVNAGCKEKDFAYISEKLEGRAKLTIAGDRALIAIQGPDAAKVLARHAPFVSEMKFMSAKACRIDGVECIISRCGYTGEDGYEISLPNEMAESFTRKLLAHREVALAGLGSRDSLRLEAGLCLYGHEIDEETTPAEADLMWSVPKRRREEKNFPGAEKILAQVEEGTARKRVGIRPQGKAPARDGTDIVDGENNVIGKVTSGGFGPTVRGPVAMGYIASELAEEGTEVSLMVRGQPRPATIVALPFVEPRQYRPGKVVDTPVEEPAEEAAEEPADEPVEEPVAEVPQEATVEEASVEEVSVEEVSTQDVNEVTDEGETESSGEEPNETEETEEEKKD